jgi:NAD(P)-dependent dehydrogenase (short-subunit alcohol dehydrogenase family)
VKTLQQLMQLSGRRALVTGGAGYIGLAVCETLLELGASVAITDIDPEACNERERVLSGQSGSGRVFSFPGDLGDESQVRGIVKAANERMGGLGIFVHCAGYVGTTSMPGWSVPFEQQSLEAFEAALRVNVGSAFVAVQAGREALEASGHGSVILVGSIYGIVGPDMSLYDGTAMGNPLGYAVSKGGLLQMARYLATVLAPGIRVNCVSPGGVERGQPQDFRDRYVARTPLNRMATEEDVKGAVAYLASDLSRYTTGQHLIVDGGFTAW